MLAFRNIFWGTVLSIAIICIIEKRINFDKYISKKRFKLEVLLRKVIDEEMDVEEFITDLPYHIKFDKSYKEYYSFFNRPRYKKIDEIFENWLNHTTKKENEDNISFLSIILLNLIRFMKNDEEVDEKEFEKVRVELCTQFRDHTWDIKVFTNSQGKRNFCLYNIKQEERHEKNINRSR